MRSKGAGANTSAVEILNVSMHGFWLYAKGKEYYLPYNEFPWFREARISELCRVSLKHGHHLRWKDLDVDLDMDSLEHPDRYPLKYKTLS